MFVESLSLSLSLSSLLLLPAAVWHCNSPACSVLSFSFNFRVTSVFHQVAEHVHSFLTTCSLPFILSSVTSCSSDSHLSICHNHTFGFPIVSSSSSSSSRSNQIHLENSRQEICYRILELCVRGPMAFSPHWLTRRLVLWYLCNKMCLYWPLSSISR